MKYLLTLCTLIILGCAHQVKKDPKKVEPKAIGETVESVQLKDINGSAIHTKDLFAEKPTVLVIYRGGWCPYCNKQLSRLRKITDDIEAKGFQLIAVSPDHPESMQASIEKNGIDEYQLFSDSKLNLAVELGLAFKVDEETIEKYEKYGIDLEKASGENHKSLPVPAVYVIDRNGKVQYRFYEPDYKVRLEENKLLGELDKL